MAARHHAMTSRVVELPDAIDGIEVPAGTRYVFEFVRYKGRWWRYENVPWRRLRRFADRDASAVAPLLASWYARAVSEANVPEKDVERVKAALARVYPWKVLRGMVQEALSSRAIVGEMVSALKKLLRKVG